MKNSGGDDGVIIKGVANLTQFVRLYANLTGTPGWTYVIVYYALIFFTIYFFFVYTRRLIILAFLTLIAPLITLTYPIDKMGDGQAQGFNTWLREFIFNVLIQPFHLLIYTVFVTAVIEFANTNFIYTIVVLAFILEAEKILRSMFGFDKSKTASMMGAAAGGALVMSAVQKLAGGVKGGKGRGKRKCRNC